MKRFTIGISFTLLLLATTLAADYREPDYRGQVFEEVRIDDDGIVLIDSTGNVLRIPVGQLSDGSAVADDRWVSGGRDTQIFEGCTEIYDKITKIGGSVVLSADECVEGDVVVMGGNATIRGKVSGSVTATGRIRIASSAVVRGNVAGSEVIAEPGSDIWGTTTETEFPWPPEAPVKIPHRSSEAMAMLSFLVVQFGAVVLAVMVFPRATDRLKTVFRVDIFKALAVGFVAEILFLPAFVLLLITIIGIPIALLGMPLALIAAGVLGLAAFSLYLSDYVGSKTDAEEPSRLMKTLTGFVILQAPIIGAFFFDVVNIEPLSALFKIVTSILVLVVFTSSLGAAILTRFGSRDYSQKKATVTIEISEGGSAEEAADTGRSS